MCVPCWLKKSKRYIDGEREAVHIYDFEKDGLKNKPKQKLGKILKAIDYWKLDKSDYPNEVYLFITKIISNKSCNEIISSNSYLNELFLGNSIEFMNKYNLNFLNNIETLHNSRLNKQIKRDEKEEKKIERKNKHEENEKSKKEKKEEKEKREKKEERERMETYKVKEILSKKMINDKLEGMYYIFKNLHGVNIHFLNFYHGKQYFDQNKFFEELYNYGNTNEQIINFLDYLKEQGYFPEFTNINELNIPQEVKEHVFILS